MQTEEEERDLEPTVSPSISPTRQIETFIYIRLEKVEALHRWNEFARAYIVYAEDVCLFFAAKSLWFV